MTRRLLAVVIPSMLMACSTPANQDTNGLVALTSAEPAGANCASGGVRLRFGLDANGNKSLDEDEVDAALTQYVCNGVSGQNGMNGLPGMDGTMGTMGTMGTAGAQGPAGPAGPATVSINTPEMPGMNCRYGGVQVQFGPDIDGDLVLDPGEINSGLTRFICNGTAGVKCHDLNNNDVCEPSTEDKDLDGDCDVDDCHSPNNADFIQNQVATAQDAGFNIAGTGSMGRLRLLEPSAPANSVDMLLVRASPCCGASAGPLRDFFKIQNTGGFLAGGILGSGTIPAIGAGERLMWHPNKAAFRAGSIGSAGTQWDDPNVGYYTWAGGYNTIALGLGAFAMGYQSTALGSYSTAVGYTANADGTGAVALGYRTTADADYSVAIGQRASANGRAGSLVFSDASTTDSLQSSANNQFSVRAAGGYRLFTNATMTAGVSLAAGGSSWAVISDRNAKTDFAEFDGEDVLHKLSKMPVQSWVYKAEVGHPRHVGPMAQDFYGAFGLGHDDVTINSLDLDGVSLAAAKALERRTAELMEKSQRVGQLETEVARLRQETEQLKAAMQRLEARLPKQK